VGSWYVLIKRVFIAAAPDPATHTVALTWVSGETTVNSFGHFRGLRRSGYPAAAHPAA
jgi:hypothetical protein